MKKENYNDFEYIGFKEPTPEEQLETADKVFGGKAPISYMPHRNCYLYSEKQEDGSRKIAAEPIDPNKPMNVSGLQYSSLKPDDTYIEHVKTVQNYTCKKLS